MRVLRKSYIYPGQYFVFLMKILIYLTDVVIQIQPRRKGEYCISVDMAALPSHTEHFSALDGGLLILRYAQRRGGTLRDALGAFRHKQDSTLVAEQAAIFSVYPFLRVNI